MKTTLITVILTTITATAGLIPLNVTRSISISGVAGDESYAETESFTELGNWEASIDNIAGANHDEWFQSTGLFHAESSATQNSLISSDQISLSGSLFGDTWTSFSGPTGPADAFASSVFEVDFSILVPHTYTLDLDMSILWHDLPFPNSAFTFDNMFFRSTPGEIQLSGLLLPGIYTLSLNSDIHSVADPIGDFKVSTYNAKLQVTPVPEASSSILLLAIALVIIIPLLHGTSTISNRVRH